MKHSRRQRPRANVDRLRQQRPLVQAMMAIAMLTEAHCQAQAPAGEALWASAQALLASAHALLPAANSTAQALRVHRRAELAGNQDLDSITVGKPWYLEYIHGRIGNMTKYIRESRVGGRIYNRLAPYYYTARSYHERIMRLQKACPRRGENCTGCLVKIAAAYWFAASDVVLEYFKCQRCRPRQVETGPEIDETQSLPESAGKQALDDKGAISTTEPHSSRSKPASGLSLEETIQWADSKSLAGKQGAIDDAAFESIGRTSSTIYSGIKEATLEDAATAAALRHEVDTEDQDELEHAAKIREDAYEMRRQEAETNAKIQEANRRKRAEEEAMWNAAQDAMNSAREQAERKMAEELEEHEAEIAAYREELEQTDPEQEKTGEAQRRTGEELAARHPALGNFPTHTDHVHREAAENNASFENKFGTAGGIAMNGLQPNASVASFWPIGKEDSGVGVSSRPSLGALATPQWLFLAGVMAAAGISVYTAMFAFHHGSYITSLRVTSSRRLSQYTARTEPLLGEFKRMQS